MRTEQTILKALVKNEVYTRKVIPFLKESYFSAIEDRVLFREISSFISKYNTCPSCDSLSTEIDNLKGHTDETVKSIQETLEIIKTDTTETNLNWLEIGRAHV